MNQSTYKLIKWFYVIVASLMIGAVNNVVLFFTAAFLFAGDNGGAWVQWYFGTADGAVFVLVTILLAIPILPFTRKLNLVLG